MNTDYLSDSSKKQQLSQLLDSYNISHLVNFPIRFQHNHISAIDSIFVNNAQLHQCNILPIHNGLSDHDTQCLLLKNLFIKKKKLSGKYKTRLFTTDAIGHFQKLLLEETWETGYQKHDVNSIFNKLLRVYLNIFEASFPIVYFNKHNDNAWITKGIRISCRKKRSLYLLSRNCNNPEVKRHCKHYCSILRKTIREAKDSILMN